MKNVTGYDMTKLFVGSFGILGIITEVTFRLLPRYDTQGLIVLPLPSLGEAKAVVAGILRSHLQPLALEVVSPDGLSPEVVGGTSAAAAHAGGPVLLAGFAGHRAAVDRSVREVMGTHSGPASEVLREESAEALYDHLAATSAVGPDGDHQIAVRASVPVSRALDLAEAAERYAEEKGFVVSYRAGAARGRVDLVFADPSGTGAALEHAERSAECVSRIRAEAVGLGGSLFVTQGSSLLPTGFDPWGDIGPALGLMRRLKERFDPNRILNPGRFLGGI
jgi:glycolate oxidase FAD binding subunit